MGAHWAGKRDVLTVGWWVDGWAAHSDTTMAVLMDERTAASMVRCWAGYWAGYWAGQMAQGWVDCWVYCWVGCWEQTTAVRLDGNWVAPMGHWRAG